jgi:hypothetical protein
VGAVVERPARVGIELVDPRVAPSSTLTDRCSER